MSNHIDYGPAGHIYVAPEPEKQMTSMPALVPEFDNMRKELCRQVGPQIDHIFFHETEYELFKPVQRENNLVHHEIFVAFFDTRYR